MTASHAFRSAASGGKEPSVQAVGMSGALMAAFIAIRLKAASPLPAHLLPFRFAPKCSRP